MRVSILATLSLCLVACFSTGADAKVHRHRVHPMVQALGIGFAHVLKEARAHRHHHHARHAHRAVHHARMDATSDRLVGAALAYAGPGDFAMPGFSSEPPMGRKTQARVPRLSDAIRSGLVTIKTAAGITVTVAQDFAPKIAGFIGDIVALGYRPGKIHCYANGGHVSHSLHYSGRACDFDQRGWGKTATVMYHVRTLTSKWGLRDGCTFRDCGHIDAGFGGRTFAHRYHRRHYAGA